MLTLIATRFGDFIAPLYGTVVYGSTPFVPPANSVLTGRLNDRLTSITTTQLAKINNTCECVCVCVCVYHDTYVCTYVKPSFKLIWCHRLCVAGHCEIQHVINCIQISRLIYTYPILVGMTTVACMYRCMYMYMHLGFPPILVR